MSIKPAYYNEINEFAAKWLRNLIRAGHIAPGDVDERSIEDVHPQDLKGYRQCHFFAGIGVWSYALRLAGWEDDREVWTGSCPCQPFSTAGKGAGFADERHLWPAWNHLIEQRRPSVVFGEQVASADGLEWLDLVSADLQVQGYAFGAADLCAAGVGAPHIRQRLFFVGDANYSGLEGFRLGHPTAIRHGERAFRSIAEASRSGRMDYADSQPAENQVSAGWKLHGSSGVVGHASPTHGLWRDADWLYCRDGKWRPVEPGTFPLAHGAPARVGRLRAYGNAINAEVARTFIEAYRDVADTL